MGKINRREFIEKALLCNGYVFAGSTVLTPWFGNLFSPQAYAYHVAIQGNNPSISWSEEKCKGCKECVTACSVKQNVQGTYKFAKGHHVCIHCGACIQVCTYGALTEKYSYNDVFTALNDPSKVVIASIAPSVPAAIGEYFGMAAGSYLPGNLTGACKKLGFDYVLNNNFSADLTVIEEAYELQKRIENKSKFPQFTSCCPAWVKYVEMYYPALTPHLSSAKSPFSMQGALIKTYFADKMKINPSDIVHVAIAPCTAKKYEILRDELSTDNLRSTDIEITTNELAMMLRDKNIQLLSEKGKYDSLMGKSSGAAAAFGNTGGVMTAALRTAYFNMTGSNPSPDFVKLTDVEGEDGIKEATAVIGDKKLNVAVCYEMRNAKKILDQVKAGTCKYDFVEVMACKGGCVGGAGQPAKSAGDLEKRMNALKQADVNSSTRFSHQNPDIKKLYKQLLKNPGSIKSEELLHTTYLDKSSLLVPKKG
jgi:ferredoxin hydrogenase